MRTEAITIEAGAHVVHFYADDADLINTVGGYAAAAIGGGDATLIIATRNHREALAAHLDAAGIDVAEAGRSGTLVTIDAAATLARFYAEGRIDADQFRSVIGGTIREVARHSGRTVRCHGEMVALLWDAGAITAAIELEDLWNDLSRELAFSLLCSYPNQSVGGPEHSHARGDIRGLHSGVVDPQPGAERHFRPRQPGAAEMPGTFAAWSDLSDPDSADEVHQAVGMIAVQLGVNTLEALIRLHSFAIDHDKSLDEVAEEVVGRRLRFHDTHP